MTITTGRIVLYTLTAQNAAEINRRRTTGASIAERMKVQVSQVETATPILGWPTGAQAHIGNSAHAGQVVPLIVVTVWPNEYGPDFHGVNGQAMLDGNDTLWVTSAKEGTEPGAWAWPPRV